MYKFCKVFKVAPSLEWLASASGAACCRHIPQTREIQLEIKMQQKYIFGGLAFNPKVFLQIGFLAWWFLEKIQRKRGSGSIQNIKWCRFQEGMDYANWAQVGKTNKPAKLKKQQSQGASVCSFSGRRICEIKRGWEIGRQGILAEKLDWFVMGWPK